MLPCIFTVKMVKPVKRALFDLIGHYLFITLITVHSLEASASMPLIYFKWSDVKCCQTELWVRCVASLALLAAEVENFSSANATQALMPKPN